MINPIINRNTKAHPQPINIPFIEARARLQSFSRSHSIRKRANNPPRIPPMIGRRKFAPMAADHGDQDHPPGRAFFMGIGSHQHIIQDRSGQHQQCNDGKHDPPKHPKAGDQSVGQSRHPDDDQSGQNGDDDHAHHHGCQDQSPQDQFKVDIVLSDVQVGILLLLVVTTLVVMSG